MIGLKNIRSRVIIFLSLTAETGIGEFYIMNKNYFFISSLLMAATMSAQPFGMPKLLAPGDVPEVSNDIIYEAPEGESRFYAENYDGWIFWGSEYGLYYMAGNNSNNYMIWTEDSEVYILNPVMTLPTESYAKGTFADGKITVQLPQCIGAYQDEEGEIAYMYLNKLEEVEQDGEKYYMICYPEDNYLLYDVDENGNVALNLGNDKDGIDIENGINPQYLVGITYDNEPHALQVWSGFGDAFENWNLIPYEEPVTPPANITSEYWAFDTIGHESLLEIKIDGSDIYINGFTSYLEGYWIKGTLTPEKDIVIPTQQFMGKNEYDQLYYFLATKVIYAEDESSWNTYEMIDQITMKYDSETKKYSAPGECLCVSTYRDEIAYLALAESPMLWVQDPELLSAAPENPVLVEYNSFDLETNQGNVTWYIPNTNVNGSLLRTDRMYYNFYVDGELFTFEPCDYPLFDEPTTDVPYDASNLMDIFSYDQIHYITFKFADPETFGLQSFYVADDGTVYSSELITCDLESLGVTTSEFTKEVKDVIFYNLDGSVASHPINRSIYIKRTIFTDGTQKTEKTIIK